VRQCTAVCAVVSSGARGSNVCYICVP
jgi:hypothetical protein